MTIESISQEADQFGKFIAQTDEPIRKATKEACCAVRHEACQVLTCANEQIRKNPVPIVLGALVFGIAAGCLIMSGRHTPASRDRFISEPLDHATDAIATTLARFYENLKFW